MQICKIMNYRKKDFVRASGVVSYSIQIKRFFWWSKYQSFINRKNRDAYFDLLILGEK